MCLLCFVCVCVCVEYGVCLLCVGCVFGGSFCVCSGYVCCWVCLYVSGCLVSLCFGAVFGVSVSWSRRSDNLAVVPPHEESIPL